jgi:hypothetical protein
LGEVAQKRISGSEREKSQRGAPSAESSGKKPLTISNAVPSPPTAMKFAEAVGIGGVRAPARWLRRERAFRAPREAEARGAKLVERARRELSAASAASRRIHDREIALRSQGNHRAAVELLADLSGQNDALDFHRGVARKILVPDA